MIEGVEFRGSRRVPQDTLRALIFTKRGDRLRAADLINSRNSNFMGRDQNVRTNWRGRN